VSGVHYFTVRVQALALERGVSWLRDRRCLERADEAARLNAGLLDGLDQRWDPRAACFRARDPSVTGPRDPDISTALALLRAPNRASRHGVRDARALPAIERLVNYFRDDLPINRSRPPAAPMLGRFPGDVYFGGGAWFIATLAAAEFFYRLALFAHGGDERAERFARADAFLETASAFIPPSGWISEQIDRDSGAPLSAQRLAWSYAAFLSCASARRAVG
jgi:glucoamylase